MRHITGHSVNVVNVTDLSTRIVLYNKVTTAAPRVSF